MSRNKKRNNNNNRPNFWGMIQNVLIASMNKGQFLLGVGGLSFLIMILKLTPDDTKKLIDEIFIVSGNYGHFGWILAFIAILGWYFNTKRLRRIHSKEIARISKEKKDLQERLSKRKLQTSN